MTHPLTPREKVVFKQPCEHCQRMTTVDRTALASGSGEHAELARAMERAKENAMALALTERAEFAEAELQRSTANMCEQFNRAEALLAENAALRDREKAALKECSEWARKAGEAIGKLETSEAAGIVEGWRDRATEAERKLAEAVGLLRQALGDMDRRVITAETANRIDYFISKEAERG